MVQFVSGLHHVFSQIIGWFTVILLLILAAKLAKKGWMLWRRADVIDSLIKKNLEKIKAAELSPYEVANYVSQQWAYLSANQLLSNDKLNEQFEELVFVFYTGQNRENSGKENT